MPIIELQGDLLQSDCNVICHVANCFHVMGAGIARQIKIKYPSAYEADLRTPYGAFSKIGTVSSAKVDNRLIFNCYAQWDYSSSEKQIEYGGLYQCLKAVSRFPDDTGLIQQAPFKIGMPRLGCGLAGGDWSVVKQIIETVFPNTLVYVYTL